MKSQDIAKSIFYLLEQGVEANKLNDAFQKFLKVNHFEALLPKIIWYLEYFYKKSQEQNSLRIVSAHEVSDETLKKIQKHLDLKDDINTSVDIDKEIIAGFIAYYSGKEYDASIKTQLSRLKQAIIYNQ